jgi:hypothetical protein
MYRYNEFGVMHFRILKKIVVLKNFSIHTLTKIFSRCFAGTGNTFSADTWRKEYKSHAFAPGQYFSQLQRDVSARAA